MKQLIYIYLLSCITLSLGLTLQPCLAGASKDDTQPIKIGIYLPLTGKSSHLGKAVYDGIAIANQLKSSVLSKKIEIILEDTASDKTKAALAVKTLIQNKVCALIGEATDENTAEESIIAEKLKVPLIIPAATGTSLIKEKQFSFQIPLTDIDKGRIAAGYALNVLQLKKASVLVEINRSDHVQQANSFVETFTHLGGKIVAAAYCKTGDRDFTLHLSSILASKPQILFLPVSYRELIAIREQIMASGINIPLFSTDYSEDTFLSPQLLDGTIFICDYSNKAMLSQISKTYIETYEKEFGKASSASSALGADAYLLLVDAIERAKSIDAAKVRNALAHTTNFRGLCGSISFSDANIMKKDGIIVRVNKEKGIQFLSTFSY